MPLPTAYPRKLIHSRKLSFSGYQRNDGLWDIEGVLIDTKPFSFEMLGERTWSPNEPIHNMAIRITVNSRLVIEDIHTSMDYAPHAECPHTLSPMKKFIGAQLGGGWRKTIEENLGKTKGCAHLRELLFNIGTAAFQTVTSVFEDVNSKNPPPHLNQCVGWRLDSDLVKRTYPMFFQPRVDENS